ncbi:hypothetical protein [Sphingomonas sp.]|uniref:hypothetical protein n=1 Tax=Sphingomonas sp. TaxID=28214 RepID=UPI0025E4D5A4|nr:hypothetical protein [Sphingomonas sp.]
MRHMYLSAIAISFATPAMAVPLAPPRPDTLKAVQSFIRALVTKDAAAYGDMLAEDFAGYESMQSASENRETWLGKIRKAFANDGFHASIMQVFSTSDYSSGRYRARVILVENASNFTLRDGITGDCCTYYLTETITFDGGKIVRIDRSDLFDNRLSTTGERTDLR